jgi:hypothetical protein
MTLDILAALNAAPSRGKKRCNLALFLDDIPEDTAGRDELIRLVESRHDTKSDIETRSAQNMAVVLSQLGFEVTANPIHDHRNRACRCYR